MFSYSFYFECYEVSTTTFGGAPTLLSTLYFCKFAGEGHKGQLRMTRITLCLLSRLTHWCWGCCHWRAGDSLSSRALRTWRGRAGCSPGRTSPRPPRWPGYRRGRGSHQPEGRPDWDLETGELCLSLIHISEPTRPY